MSTRYGTPEDVRFCKTCVMSNSRPSSVVERANTGGPKPTLAFDADGRCAACVYQFDHIDVRIDWEAREHMLRDLLNQYRSKAGNIDCIVPGSGGKDSCYAAHVLATRYGMHPLTVTWAPMIWTDVGKRNYERWARLYPHHLMERDERTHRTITRLAFERLAHPFSAFVVGQRHCAAKVALDLGVPLACYGEPPAQNAGPVEECYDPCMRREFYAADDDSPWGMTLGGVPATELVDAHGVDGASLYAYAPISTHDADALGVDFRFLGHYLRWDPMDVFYYASEHCGFECNDRRTRGSYSKFSSLDDAMDELHYFTSHVKFSVGRATYDASTDVRWGHRTREEGVALVRKYDGEAPDAETLARCLDYMGIDEPTFWRVIDDARPEHLWERKGDTWKLKHQVA